MDQEAWHYLVVTGVGLAVAAYCYVAAQNEAFDGDTPSTVEIIADSLNDTGLTDDTLQDT